MRAALREFHPTRTIDHRVAIGGVRPDGVAIVDIGAGLSVLVNLLDGSKTMALDGQDAERYGPFRPIHPTPELRTHIQEILDAPGIVEPQHIGADSATLTLDGPQFSRQELVDMLTAANLQVDQMLPPEPTLAEDKDFLSTCLTSVVPQLSSAGIMVGDPSLFCAALYLQRTGLMPHGMGDDMSAGMGTPPPSDQVPVRPPVDTMPPSSSPNPNEPPTYSETPADVVNACGPDMMNPDGTMKMPCGGAIGKPNKRKNMAVAEPAGKPNA
jgi:hypothetical protein